MKTLKLILLTAFVSGSAGLFAQSNIYLDTVFISTYTTPKEIVLKQKGLIKDTCRNRSEEVIIHLPITNNTDEIILSRSEVMVWYDCGFAKDNHSKIAIIKPGETQICEVKVVPAGKRWMHYKGRIPVKSPKYELQNIPMAINFDFDSYVCNTKN